MFDSPLRRRLIVVSLLPKACRKANGNSAGVERLLGQRRNGFFNLNGVHDRPFPHSFLGRAATCIIGTDRVVCDVTQNPRYHRIGVDFCPAKRGFTLIAAPRRRGRRAGAACRREACARPPHRRRGGVELGSGACARASASAPRSGRSMFAATGKAQSLVVGERVGRCPASTLGLVVTRTNDGNRRIPST